MNPQVRRDFTFAHIELPSFPQEEDLCEAHAGSTANFAQLVKPNAFRQPKSFTVPPKQIPKLQRQGSKSLLDLRIGAMENSPKPSARRYITPELFMTSKIPPQ